MKKKAYYPWMCWGVAALFYLYEMVLRASTSVMADDLMRTFQLTGEGLGMLSALYYWAYTPLQLPCGVLLDKIGVRTLLTVSCLLCAVSAIMFGHTQTTFIAGCARFIMGAGSSCAFISCLMLITAWFPALQFTFMAGLTNFMGTLGGMIAGEPLALLSRLYGWRNALIYLGYGGIVLAIILWTVLRNPPVVHDKKEVSTFSLMHNLSLMFKQKELWWIGLIGGLLYLPISAFAELWAVPFMQAAYDIDQQKAAHIPMVLYLSVGLGSALSSNACAMVKSYKKILFVACVAGAVFFGLLACAPFFPFWVTMVWTICGGMVLGAQILCFSLANNAAPTHVRGTVSAFTNALIMFCGLIFQPLLGYILTLSWNILGGKYAPDGTSMVYTAPMYRYAIFMLPLCFFLCIELLRHVRDPYGKDTKSINNAP